MLLFAGLVAVVTHTSKWRICTINHVLLFLFLLSKFIVMSEAIFSKEGLVTELNNNTDLLLQTLTGFSKEQFNKIPFEGSWTAGQVAEHLYKSELGFPSLFKTKLTDTERAIDEKMQMIRSTFLNFDTKMKSPDFILPGNDEQDPETMAKLFDASRKAINEVVNTIDLSQTVADIPFPGMGTFTGWEWLCFTTCHSIRHTRQLQNIHAELNPAS